jgi:hypothetical protein
MRVRVWSQGLVVVAVFAALLPVPAGAQSSNTETNIVVTDVVPVASLVGQNLAAGPQGSIANGFFVPDVTVTYSGTITGTIEGLVRRQGTQTNYAGIEIVAIAAGDGVTATTTTSADGDFVMTVLMSGTYAVAASYPGYLRAQRGSISVAGAAADVGPTMLVGGDVNADNCINVLDFVSIVGRFGLTKLPASDPYDVNDDGTVNILDLTIAAGNFTRCGPMPWIP